MHGKKIKYGQQFRVEMLRRLMVRQIRTDMEMMEQTERKSKAEGRREERKGVLRRVISSKISV